MKRICFNGVLFQYVMKWGYNYENIDKVLDKSSNNIIVIIYV